MRLGYVLDEVFTRHRPPGQHPERPARLLAVRDALDAVGLEERARRLGVRQAREEELVRVHDAGYLAALERTVPGRAGWLDGDTYYSPETWAASLAAAAAAVDLTAAVLDGGLDRGLALVRPPGHHAARDRAMGFCLLNNVAVAAAAARAGGVERVAVFDWDVHHGNGTQHMFEADPAVLYISTHQYPLYPGTGAATEVGVGAGAGATVNVPLPEGCGDVEFAAAWNEVILPALERHRPELILVSAGFDAHVDDPLAGMRVTAAGFGQLASAVCAVADRLCERRVVCVLEGGYDLGGLGASAAAVFAAFVADARPRGAELAIRGQVAAGAREAIDATRAALAAVGA